MTFENIQEYYDYLENDNSLSNDLNLFAALINLRDKTEDIKLKAECYYEVYLIEFNIVKGDLKPQTTNINGDEYPSFTLFDDDLKYLKDRAESIQNPKYKAKYNHLLWKSKFQHFKYAKLSIDNYFLFLNTVLFPLNDGESDYYFNNYFQNLFILSQSINYRKEEVIEFFIAILDTKRINGFKECSLIKFIVEEGKKVSNIILQLFFDYSNKVIDNSIYPDFTEAYLQLLIILSSKLNISPKSYYNRLAAFYLTQSEEQKESFVVNDYYLKALSQYKRAGNKEKIEEVTVLIEKAKKNLNFKSIKIERTNEILQHWWNTIMIFTDNLIEKHQSKDIYEYIMLSNNIFPKANILPEIVRPATFDLISVMNFDINKNISSKEKSGINLYFNHIQNFTIKHLWLIFSKGIKSGKISYQTLIEFLNNNTWYGQNFTYLDEEGEISGFNWIELLSPSLSCFFTQSEIDIKSNKNNNQGYILAIDSLVIKFEGLLREFSRSIGAQTIEIKENETQERISFEKLLENPKLNELLPEDDIALFKFLFTSDGMNLRNNIAHCFYTTKKYSSGLMFLLIAALLKLGNYKLEPLPQL